ncbi:MAG: hypothetical protein U0797_19405 [Gemmataceae bacterium]
MVLNALLGKGVHVTTVNDYLRAATPRRLRRLHRAWA